MVNTAMKKYSTKDKEKPADIGITKAVREKGSVPIYTVKHMNQEKYTKSQIKIKVMTLEQMQQKLKQKGMIQYEYASSVKKGSMEIQK